jgi:hypothetical protein
MGWDITKRLLGGLKEAAAGLPDGRQRPEIRDGRFFAKRVRGILESYRVLNGTIPAAPDGTRYFSSEEIRCDHCLKMEKKNRKGETKALYYHDMAAAAIVKPGKPAAVLPLIPEFIRNEDGSGKQDCGRTAAKRRVNTRKERYAPPKPTVLGDDLYCCHSICEQIPGAKMSSKNQAPGLASAFLGRRV